MEKAYEKLDNKVCPICRGRGEVLSPDHGEWTMIIVREAAQQQVAKLDKVFSLEDMQFSSTGCKGECWNCDSCGGSATH